MKTMYFDNAATTKVDDNVAEEMKKYLLEEYGNASSVHAKGREAKIAIEKARDVIASSINARSEEIFFTSGGTEANNWALKGLFFANKKANTGKNHIITTKIEHDCVLNTCKWLESQGAKVTYLDVDKDGLINPKDVENAITRETFIVSIIHGNNEIGTLQALEEIGKICRSKGVYFHIDACQSYTKTDISVKKQNLDLVTLNAHKIHGPKGVGALYIRKEVEIEPLFHGGGHENGKRSGTENVPGIVGFARAVRNSSSSNIKKMIKMKNKIIEKILEMSNTRLNGVNGDRRLCNNINVSFKNIEGEPIGS
jgi:cysteine desulfurase